MNKIAGMVLFSFLLASSAAAAEEHIVSQGDTLFKLSRQYGMTVEQLKQMNHLSSDMLLLGQKLTVNTKDSAPPALIGPLPVETAPLLRNALINGDSVNVREEGNLQAKVVTSLKRGASVQVIERGEQWTKVRVGMTQIGYIFTPLLTFAVETTSRSSDMSTSRLQQVISPLIGIPYRTGGTSLDGFDCSGFTMYVMQQMGIKLPRVSEEQFTYGTSVQAGDWKPGDLLFFDSYGAGKITHVGIYLGNNKIAHSAVKAVEISDVTWYLNNYPFYGAQRVIAE
ncbi:NlpC/P60 family protein [Ammoniphilus sp. YIM 78166]|uniref:C40 family peptidase n=1 Tax=Ammoniphilus sp. YIM 78166 TaxID=1644106 RepID=UPI00106FD83A|nr:NlpC/P60 family protein [Ammoniphilus sp. YIM 78166]